MRGLITRKLVLLLSGLTASGIAATIFFAPDAFYASYEIDLAGNTNLTNELKASAGALFVAGLLMLLGVFRATLTFVSLVAAAAIYLAYGLSRFLSIAIDGIPHSSLVGAAIFEIAIGVACLLTLLSELKSYSERTTN
jgi:glucan phosphoethanolaminetransferase (alkaline phosphatase superfamily)